MSNLNEIERESFLAVSEILEASRIKPGDIFVVGCSSSEVLGEKIGTDTNLDVAGAIYDGVIKALNEKAEQPIFLAAQCCEHLNRALVVERACMEKYGFEQVNAIPQPNHAGGAFATVAYQRMQDPVLVESIEARGQAGIDIGGTHAHSSGCGTASDFAEEDRRSEHHLCAAPPEICRWATRDL